MYKMSNIHQLGLVNPFAKTSVKVGNTVLNMPTDQIQDNYPASHDTFKVVSPASQTPSFGGYVDFQLDGNVIDVLTDVTFVLSVGALTTTGGTYKRFISGVENHLLRVEISAADQIIETVYPESITVRNALLNTNESKNRFYRLIGNDTSANLVTAAAGAQTFFLSIPSFYNTNHGWFLKAMTVPLRFRFYLANLTVGI